MFKHNKYNTESGDNETHLLETISPVVENSIRYKNQNELKRSPVNISV